ncbi:transmembrane protein [Citrus sinensis]|uniref:Transmembrane protein n=1 Tax=Citrus sinensis TaxID=2711 RepID=A0ACB8MHF4_CITSI|nr:transmembrane protein [Citrus sinensis]
MTLVAILTHGQPLNSPKPTPKLSNLPPLKRTPSSCSFNNFSNTSREFLYEKITNFCTSQFFKQPTFRIRSFDSEGDENYVPEDSPDEQDQLANDEILKNKTVETSGFGSSFLAKLTIAVGVAATITLLSIGLKPPNLGTSFGVQRLAEGSSSSLAMAAPSGFSFKVFGYKFILPQYAPGWIYFWLLMAAGSGLFISEEALNIWVCPSYWYLCFADSVVSISLARLLTLDGTWQSFAESFSRNAPYIVSTVLWVYWGVCISDMIPFYLGKLFTKSGASDDVCSKLGISKEKALSITQSVQKYGNLIGFERFSLGVRNPTAFLAGTMGIPPDCFFAGVCCGGLLTLPIQLVIGFLLRERPVFALATVATVVLLQRRYSFTCDTVTLLSPAQTVFNSKIQ